MQGLPYTSWRTRRAAYVSPSHKQQVNKTLAVDVSKSLRSGLGSPHALQEIASVERWKSVVYQ